MEIKFSLVCNLLYIITRVSSSTCTSTYMILNSIVQYSDSRMQILGIWVTELQVGKHLHG